MKESFWGAFVLGLGIMAIAVTFVFQNITNTNEHNYHMLKEITESAMFDAFDLGRYKQSGIVRIDEEKFVENFIRRFGENVSLARNYTIRIYEISEEPPFVSLALISTEDANIDNEVYTFNIQNRVDAVLEIPTR